MVDSSPDDSVEGLGGSVMTEKQQEVERKAAPTTNQSSTIVAPSPNTMRKRRHVEIAKKVEMRKALISTASSSRLDIGKVHSLLSGPRLSWDSSKSSSSSHHDDHTDDSCGLIVEDFHADSRSALRTNISKALSQMASRDINTQQVTDSNSQLLRDAADEEIMKIIELKKKRMLKKDDIDDGLKKMTVSTKTIENIVAEFDEEEEVGGIGENLPVLEPIEEEEQPERSFVQTAPPVIEEQYGDDAMSPTQIFQRADDDEEEELEMDTLAMEPTQVYRAPSQREDTRSDEVVRPERIESKSSVASSALPPNTARVEGEDEGENELEDEVESSSEEETATTRIPAEMPGQIKKRDQEEFAAWLVARNKRKKQKRKGNKGDEARMFFEAEAEESEDEELGGIMRRREDSDAGSSSDEGDIDSDLDELVASAADEFVLEKKSGKDSKKLAKLHAKWAAERDAALEKAIEDRDFMRRKQLMNSRSLVDDGGAEGGLNRMQRKLKARRDAMVEQFDREGNLLAPEYVSEESDYDSMEIDSDDFFDEEDEDWGDREGELDPQEIEARKERKRRDLERRKKEMEFKMEMKKRRQQLKEKLRQERLMREKDKREIQAGLGIMNEEDREVFKMINRSQVFGYTGKDGSTTQSTVASTNASSQFSFLGAMKPNILIGSRRRSSATTLELE